jgi:osmoprotectant transport system ATP-binding protein
VGGLPEAAGVIDLENIEMTYPGGHVALRGVTLHVPMGTSLALLGPSGSGKTTLLKVINRLVIPTAGTLYIDGRDASRIDPVTLRRSIGYVVQEGALFPHLTALQNVEVVPRLLGWDRRRRHGRARELFAMMGLDFDLLASRYPAQLSGGQQQRIGLARALAADPPLVLMDEPFAALDPPNRRRLQDEFLSLEGRLRKTVVLVTHDVEEAFRLADQVALIFDGSLQRLGTPQEIETSPGSQRVADFVAAGRRELHG